MRERWKTWCRIKDHLCCRNVCTSTYNDNQTERSNKRQLPWTALRRGTVQWVCVLHRCYVAVNKKSRKINSIKLHYLNLFIKLVCNQFENIILSTLELTCNKVNANHAMSFDTVRRITSCDVKISSALWWHLNNSLKKQSLHTYVIRVGSLYFS